MRLTPPKKIVFYISVLAIVVGAVLYLATDSADAGFWITAASGVLLAAGNALRGF